METQSLEHPVAHPGLDTRFGELIERYRPSIARLAATYEGNRTDREDLVQDIWLAVWRALPGFRGDCSERTRRRSSPCNSSRSTHDCSPPCACAAACRQCSSPSTRSARSSPASSPGSSQPTLDLALERLQRRQKSLRFAWMLLG